MDPSIVFIGLIFGANACVLNILLQVMEDGVLTDGQGNEADFNNVVVILTSNYGSELINKGRHEVIQGVKGKTLDELDRWGQTACWKILFEDR